MFGTPCSATHLRYSTSRQAALKRGVRGESALRGLRWLAIQGLGISARSAPLESAHGARQGSLQLCQRMIDTRVHTP